MYRWCGRADRWQRPVRQGGLVRGLYLWRPKLSAYCPGRPVSVVEESCDAPIRFPSAGHLFAALPVALAWAWRRGPIARSCSGCCWRRTARGAGDRRAPRVTPLATLRSRQRRPIVALHVQATSHGRCSAGRQRLRSYDSFSNGFLSGQRRSQLDRQSQAASGRRQRQAGTKLSGR